MKRQHKRSLLVFTLTVFIFAPYLIAGSVTKSMAVTAIVARRCAVSTAPAVLRAPNLLVNRTTANLGDSVMITCTKGAGTTMRLESSNSGAAPKKNPESVEMPFDRNAKEGVAADTIRTTINF